MPRVAKWLGNAMEGLLGAKMPAMKVIEVQGIGPNIKKIRFKGVISGMDFQLGYAVAIRVSDTEFRNYTISYHDVSSGILEIIFFMHGAAPGTDFINRLNIGDEIRISMPRGQKQYDPLVKQYLIFGDETSLGLACAFQSVLRSNGHLFQFYFELREVNKDVPALLGLENYTVFSSGDTFKNEQWINGLPVFQSSEWRQSNYVLTGNVRSVQTFRKMLKKSDCAGKIYSKGYWLQEKAGL